ncbi:uncharacterized protein LOC122529543 [Frieseomelitta varia]|uniref:uncharacterized protein LOC122529543 n=1 Tax=Frieseomelitta varia TaxID=561572 RepID=UPI001CB69B3C|nr:uncharacterized protein LOC122529543 [Frieseomelitta varia]XP_043511717.1 uncharacterized protein LOC122529543 [Frieseomelitta varia]XP_043511718.1 uncharacterized protein LOC122529543 [Frieseomelitta varia]
MSPTVASILTLSLLLALPFPAAEAGEITDLFALVRNTLKYWRRVYQMYEEEVTLGYCWAEYLLRREHYARNASQFVDPANLEFDSFEKEHAWMFAVQGHGARAKRSQTCKLGTRCDVGEKYDRKSVKERTRPQLKLNSRANETRTMLKGLSTSMIDSNPNEWRTNEGGTRRELNGQVGERFLRNLARRGGRSNGIPRPTDIREISKIAPDALASSTSASGSNKTKFKLNELRSRRADAFPKDTRLASKRLVVSTPGLVSSDVAKLENSWLGTLGEVKVSSSGQRIGGSSRSMSCRQAIVADVERTISSSERFVNTRGKLLSRVGRTTSRNSRSIKHEPPVVEGVSKFRASSNHVVLPESLPLSTTVNRGRNSSKQSSIFVDGQRFVVDYGSRTTTIEARELATAHLMLFHFQRVLAGFLATLGFFMNVGRQLMDYVDSNSALACTKDYVLGKAVHWIDS